MSGYKKSEILEIFQRHKSYFQPHYKRFSRNLNGCGTVTTSGLDVEVRLKATESAKDQSDRSKVSVFQLGTYLADVANYKLDELEADFEEWTTLLGNEQCLNIMSLQSQRYGRYVDIFIAYISSSEGTFPIIKHMYLSLMYFKHFQICLTKPKVI